MDVVVFLWLVSLAVGVGGTWAILRARHRRDVQQRQDRWGTYHAALEARLDERMARIEALERQLGASAAGLDPGPATVTLAADDQRTLGRVAELIATLDAAQGPSSRELADLSRDLHRRLEVLAGELDTIGSALDQTTRICDAARRTLHQRVVPTTRRLVDLSSSSPGVPHLALDPAVPRALASGDD